MRAIIVAAALALLTVDTAAAAAVCNPTRLDADMRCCLMLTCSERPGSRSVDGAVRGPPSKQGLWNLRQGFKKCQQTDESNNFLACERADKKGPYNIGRRILGLPPG